MYFIYTNLFTFRYQYSTIYINNRSEFRTDRSIQWGYYMEKFDKRCPYCGKIMSEGIIDGARYSLWWRDTDSKRGFLKSLLNLDKKNVRLSYPFYDKYCIAYLCRGCEKVVIDIAENNRNIRRDYGSDIQIE